jgi:short-subunit dehydrogenase
VAAETPDSRRCLLIGASSGIGLETARFLARDGHRLALVARRRERLEELARELPGGESRHLAIAADVRRAGEVDDAVREAGRRLGSLEVLVYAAGTARFGPLESFADPDWEEILATNLTGLFRAARATLPIFRAAGSGHLVAILSVSSRHAFPETAAYTAAKHGALGLIEALRAELRGAGIDVTAVLPGATDTPLWDRAGGDWDRSRMMRPEQVARLVAALLRETTSGMIEELRVGPRGGPL